MNKVFVYGTLLRGFGNHVRLLANKSTFLGECKANKFKMVSLGGFPGAIPSDNGDIKGEVFEVDDGVLKELDYLEGYRGNGKGFYDRYTINTDFGEAYIYTLQESYLDDHAIVNSGSWREYTKKTTYGI